MMRLLVSLVSLALALGLRAQEGAKPQIEKPQIDAKLLLGQATKKMAELSGVAFRSTEFQDAAMMRRFKSRMPVGGGDDELAVEAKWSAGVTQASLNYGDDEIVQHAGRTLARHANGEWKLRRGRLAGGAPLPFILDPQAFFEILRSIHADEMAIRHVSQTKYKGKQLVLISVTLEGRTAREAGYAGLFPQSSAGGGGMMSMMRRLGGGATPRASVTVDLAFTIDPQSHLVHRVRLKAYTESAMGGNMVVQVAGGGFGNEEEADEDEVKERDEQGNRIYKRGLPVRKLEENMSLIDLDIAFSAHGQTFAPDLNPKSRRLLRLPSGK